MDLVNLISKGMMEYKEAMEITGKSDFLGITENKK